MNRERRQKLKVRITVRFTMMRLFMSGSCSTAMAAYDNLDESSDYEDNADDYVHYRVMEGSMIKMDFARLISRIILYDTCCESRELYARYAHINASEPEDRQELTEDVLEQIDIEQFPDKGDVLALLRQLAKESGYSDYYRRQIRPTPAANEARRRENTWKDGEEFHDAYLSTQRRPRPRPVAMPMQKSNKNPYMVKARQ